MRWLILNLYKKFDLNTIKSIKHYGCVNCYDVPNIAGRYCVDFGKDHIFYDYNENVEEFEEDLIKIPYTNPHFITMTYTSIERVKNILQQDNFPKNIYIDNDYGLILSIKKFIELGFPLDNNKIVSNK